MERIQVANWLGVFVDHQGHVGAQRQTPHCSRCPPHPDKQSLKWLLIVGGFQRTATLWASGTSFARRATRLTGQCPSPNVDQLEQSKCCSWICGGRQDRVYSVKSRFCDAHLTELAKNEWIKKAPLISTIFYIRYLS